MIWMCLSFWGLEYKMLINEKRVEDKSGIFVDGKVVF